MNELVNAYQNILHQSPDKLRIVYADSMIYTSKKSHDNALIGSAYLSKGMLYYVFKNHHNALDYYILANNYISKTKNQYLIYKVKYQIAQIKYYLGFYDEALSLFKQCLDYYKRRGHEDEIRPYLNSIHSLGACYNRTGNYGLCSQTNTLGLIEGKRLQNQEIDCYFFHSEGINQYFKNNYSLAIQKISRSLSGIAQNEDFANESVGRFYIGKSYMALHLHEKALPYFLQVDATFNKKRYLRTDQREVYELLINYYKNKNDLKKQLYFINQLLKADKLLTSTYSYLIRKIHKEYDTKELITERKYIKEQLSKRKTYDTILLIISTMLLLSLLFLIYRHYSNQKIYQKKYQELMLELQNGNKDKIKKDKPSLLGINIESVANVLKQLEKFERDKKFLEKELTLVKLSAAFNSNTKYLSQIIYHYREKGFVEYINDLKVDYLISLLKTDRKIRNYTNKALAEEAGFTTTQRFVNAFYSRTGMPTSYFIEKIKKTDS
ncbi:AraC family transcriptional regulator [Flavobacterium pectinovorum]|uniref:AraC family transcriptional regulator n=1 Tax=Flavobacterium pectinovorum TaxID=29533 RepID=UPI001FAE1DE0|nr:AraC family transcriptional regulator [Flavobacterium pectinovorum]